MKLSEIIWLDEVDSTNRFALENFDCLESGTLIAASGQTAGRGSKGRSWLSPPDVNVYESLLLKNFTYATHQAAWIGSLAVLKTLRDQAPRIRIGVKWPNDVLCGRKKIAGILCEGLPGNGIIIGIGVNINMPKELLAKIGRPATSLLAETGIFTDDVGAIAVEIARNAMYYYEMAQTGGIAELHELWSAENVFLNRKAEIQMPDGTVLRGLLADFTADGKAVLLNEADSQIYTIANGELLIPQEV